MRDTRDERGRSGQRDRSTTNRWIIPAMGLMLLLIVPAAPTSAEELGTVLCKIITLGQACKPFGAAPSPADPTVPVNCSRPVMTNAPQFLSWPKGAAKYPFSASCSSPARPGTMMVTWEGSWTPSETRIDRPNASETLTLTDYEPFIPSREAGTKIIMYWTARCTADPWLQGGTCHPYGSYVPDDLREAFPGIDGKSFPRTVNQMSSSLRQQLFVEYQRVNSQTSMSLRNRQNLQAMMRQSPLSQSMTPQPQQSQAMIIVPQATTPKPDTTMESAVARPRIFMRGVEPTESQPSGQQAEDAQPSSGESQATAVPDEGADAIAESVALTLDRPLHVITAKGDAVVLEPGVYEIEPIMDLHLGLAKEGQPTLLLQGTPDTHTAVISQPMALLIQEESDDLWHLMFLTPDGKRFDAVGSTSGVASRGTGRAVALPDRKLNDATFRPRHNQRQDRPHLVYAALCRSALGGFPSLAPCLRCRESRQLQCHTWTAATCFTLV